MLRSDRLRVQYIDTRGVNDFIHTYYGCTGSLLQQVKHLSVAAAVRGVVHLLGRRASRRPRGGTIVTQRVSYSRSSRYPN